MSHMDLRFKTALLRLITWQGKALAWKVAFMNDNRAHTGARIGINRSGAMWAHARFQLRHPDITSTLYSDGNAFAVCLTQPHQNFKLLCEEFDQSIRPVTVPVRLVETVSDRHEVVQDHTSATAEAWLANEPMPTAWINRLLSLLVPQLPNGFLTFDHRIDQYVFASTGLTYDQRRDVDQAFQFMGLPGRLAFHDLPPIDRTEVSANTTSTKPILLPSDAMHILSARELHALSLPSRRLVEEDEDHWRQFLHMHFNTQVERSGVDRPRKFSVLFDAHDQGDARLAELLCIYDVVHIIPTQTIDWLDRHLVTVKELEELVAVGRVRLVLPHSLQRYPSQLIDAVASVDSSALTLSRALASRTIQNGQFKDPLLYGPFTVNQRIAVLKALSQGAKTDYGAAVSAVYGAMIERLHRSYFLTGAMATCGTGFGQVLGELLFAARKIDARLELGTAGAAVEWAAALGATYLPRDFGGYDESHNAAIVANFFNRTRKVVAAPESTRLHTVVDGLLSINSMRPLDVVQGLSSRSLSQFRQLAKNMLHSPADTAALSAFVQNINADILSYEKRRERLSRYRLGATALGLAALPLSDAIGKLFFGASVVASSIVRILYDELAKRGRLGDVPSMVHDFVDAMSGMATATKMDAVVVSRTRQELRDDQ